MTLVTSHGILAEDDGWSWFCEEITGETALPTGLARSGSRWLALSIMADTNFEDPSDWGFSPVLDFDQVVPRSCPAASTVGVACAAI